LQGFCQGQLRNGAVVDNFTPPGPPPGAECGTRARHLVGERVPVAP
jgi:hypothetical protein